MQCLQLWLPPFKCLLHVVYLWHLLNLLTDILIKILHILPAQALTNLILHPMKYGIKDQNSV